MIEAYLNQIQEIINLIWKKGKFEARVKVEVTQPDGYKSHNLSNNSQKP